MICSIELLNYQTENYLLNLGVGFAMSISLDINYTQIYIIDMKLTQGFNKTQKFVLAVFLILLAPTFILIDALE